MQIFVVKNNQYLGLLRQETQSITFTYSENIPITEYIQGLNNPTNEATQLFPVFENMLPEHSQLELIKQKHNISTQIEALCFLDNIHGSYEFYNELDFAKRTQITPRQTIVYEKVKQEILDNQYTFPNILNGYDLQIDDSILHPTQLTNNNAMGLSGFQYKFGVSKDDTTKIITRHEGEASDYFIKPYNWAHTQFVAHDKNRSYIPYLLINEHIFMTLARDLGFDVPYNAIVRGKSDYHYIIKRFDRYKNTKIDHYEMLTLMNKNSEQKYLVSMNELLQTVREHINAKELLELYQFVVFSIIIGHGDLHAKNLSLIHASNKPNERQLTISPYYDISTTKIYQETKQNDIGLMVGNKQRRINKKDLLALAYSLGMKESDASEAMARLGREFITNFMHYIMALPHDIKALPYHINKYKQIPLEAKFKKYYEERKKYINEYLLNTPTQEMSENIWE